MRYFDIDGVSKRAPGILPLKYDTKALRTTKIGKRKNFKQSKAKGTG